MTEDRGQMAEDRWQRTDDRGQRTKDRGHQIGCLLSSVFRLLSFVFCLLFSVFCFFAFADKIYLKNGRAYEGNLVGRSERRYLFALDTGGEPVRVSFFMEDVEKIELGKDTVESQIPYLKEVDSLKVEVKEVKEETPKVYEMTLYQKSPLGSAPAPFTGKEIRKILDKEEYEYYQRFNEILKKYADKFAAIQNIYVNLTTADREDFISSKDYMDELYFELNNIFVPELFKKAHTAYLGSVKATYLAFNALEQGMLDEAAKQIKVSEDTKESSMQEFRNIILAKKEASPEPKEDSPKEE